jgi:hypothetical protein
MPLAGCVTHRPDARAAGKGHCHATESSTKLSSRKSSELRLSLFGKGNQRIHRTGAASWGSTSRLGREHYGQVWDPPKCVRDRRRALPQNPGANPTGRSQRWPINPRRQSATVTSNRQMSSLPRIAPESASCANSPRRQHEARSQACGRCLSPFVVFPTRLAWATQLRGRCA